MLAPGNREHVVRFAARNVLVAFDYDGTLAPIVEDPRDARMRDATRSLLREVSLRFPTVVISGRRQADVLERLEGAPVFAAIGNHGMEPWWCTADDRRRAAAWGAQLRPDIGALPGVWIEDKEYSLAVHYRQAPDPDAACREILRAAGRLDEVRVVGGKRVCNLLPRRAPGKGAALEMARARLGCDSAIFVGDDDTDEDVFRLDSPGRLLTIRVGPDSASKATFTLRDQLLLDDLLQTLVALRRERGACDGDDAGLFEPPPAGPPGSRKTP